MSKSLTKKVYLDNNGTTHPPKSVKNKMIKALDMGNPSSHYAKTAQKTIEDFMKFLRTNLGTGVRDYELILTSGGSESNATIITSSVLSFKERTGAKPHIIVSSIEHKCILKTCQSLVKKGMLECSVAKVNKQGRVSPVNIGKMIKDNTCLVTIMYANNEIGSINDIEQIAQICHKKKVPFHTDACQAWGKLKFKPKQMGVDAFSLSFHKIYGPPGIGILGIRKAFIKGYQLEALIGGMQNNEMRGGTINFPALAGAFTGTKWFFTNRSEKNKRLAMLSNELLNRLAEHGYKVGAYPTKSGINPTSASKMKSQRPEILLIGPKKETERMPHTLLLCIVKKTGEPFCNIDLRNALLRKGFIISIGAACNTTQKTASHVLFALDMPKELRCGVIRVSIGDQNTLGEIRRFARTLSTYIDNVAKN